LAPRSSSKDFTESMQSLKRALLKSALFSALLYLTAGYASAEITCPPSKLNETSEVAYVHDGDTLKLKDGRKVRLIGINAPELARNNAPAESFAYPAKNALRKLIKTSSNIIGLSFGLEREDKYKRTLAHLFLPDGTNIQTHLISQGLATAFTTPPNDRMADCYKQIEDIAIDDKQGIWSLNEYQITRSIHLKKSDRGFRRIQGQVLSTRRGPKAFWIHMQGNLRIRIPATDLYNFNLYELKQLTGKSIRIRGWIHGGKKGHFMMLRHPSSLIFQPK
jgi:endonuclease YncB( thermonuclease family)